MAHYKVLAVLLLSAACGGVAEPTTFDATPTAPPDSGPHFVCELSNPVRTLDCTTLDDGGPSYLDLPGNVDCRVYFAGAGQGCVPAIGCEAWVDGGLVSGMCVNQGP